MNDVRILNFKSDIDILKDEFKKFYKQDMIVPIIGSGFTLNEKNRKGNRVSSGETMKEYMVKKIMEYDNQYLEDELKDESFSSVADIYYDCVPLVERKNIYQIRLRKSF